jgi:cell wall-associated NlpC family hydrolase/SH3-like domain-containing protein
MKRKILVPVFASFMALSMNGIAHADDAKTEKRTDDKKANEKNIIDLENFKNVDYKVATIKEGVAVKVRQQGEVQTIAYAGDEFKIVGEQDGWYKVQLDDETEGWIASRYVDVKGADAYITADKVNFRKDAHVESDVQDELDLSTKVKVLDTKDNWVKVKKGDQEGYIRDLYVSDKAPVVEEQETQNDAQDQNNGQVLNTEQTTNTNDNSAEESNTDNSTTTNNNDAVVEDTTTNNNSDKNTTSNNNTTTNNNSNDETSNTTNNNNNNNNNNNSNNNQSSNEAQKPAEKPSKPVSNSNAASAVVSLAYAKLGLPYVWGAEGPSSFDCSGLTSYVFRNAAGVSLPRTSGAQYGVGTSVSKANLQAGDLVFFATGGGGISHVGIYVGGGNMIHAPQSGDVVKVSNINSSYWQNAYVGAKRVL